MTRIFPKRRDRSTHAPTRLAFLTVALIAGSPSPAAADTQGDPFARDILILTDWFEGEFDNEEQVWFEADVRRDRDDAEFTILMRNKEYPYYATRPDFIYFSIRRKGESRSVVFTVNDPLSRRLGVNFDGILAHCYLDGYDFRESYENLQ